MSKITEKKEDFMGIKKVLVLGSGMVAGPLIRYLLEKRIELTVASNDINRAKEMVADHLLSKVEFWEAGDDKKLEQMIKEHAIVISLLPYAFHVDVAKVCIKYKKHLVTTSYVSKEMSLLNEKAKDAGVLLLNECGLDPGIDHMSAKRVIDTVHGLGGKIKKFYSITGALPAPEISDANPFRYKFSWSPKGVILAGNNDAQYLKNSKKINVDGKDLFKHPFEIICPKVDTLEVYPNRDSLPYIDLYGIAEVETMYRGTFRYKGWCEIMHNIKTLGLTNQDKIDCTGLTYAELMAKLIKEKDTKEIDKKVAKYLKVSLDSVCIRALAYLGLFENKKMQRTKDSTFEILSDLMIEKMMLGNSERDMSVMQHIFLAEYTDGKQEIIRSRMLEFGSADTETSIAKTVALPAACAASLILDEEISLTGVQVPVLPEIYNPIMTELETMGIELVEEYGLPVGANNIDL